MSKEENINLKKDVKKEEDMCGCICAQKDIGENVIIKEDDSGEDNVVTEENTCERSCIQTCTEENMNTEKTRDVISDITKIFDDTNCAYSLKDVIDELKRLGYENPGTAILYAMQDDLLCVDSIEDDGLVYLAILEQDEEE
jgi:hypothetical protein